MGGDTLEVSERINDSIDTSFVGDWWLTSGSAIGIHQDAPCGCWVRAPNSDCPLPKFNSSVPWQHADRNCLFAFCCLHAVRTNDRPVRRKVLVGLQKLNDAFFAQLSSLGVISNTMAIQAEVVGLLDHTFGFVEVANDGRKERLLLILLRALKQLRCCLMEPKESAEVGAVDQGGGAIEVNDTCVIARDVVEDFVGKGLSVVIADRRPSVCTLLLNVSKHQALEALLVAANDFWVPHLREKRRSKIPDQNASVLHTPQLALEVVPQCREHLTLLVVAQLAGLAWVNHSRPDTLKRSRLFERKAQELIALSSRGHVIAHLAQEVRWHTRQVVETNDAVAFALHTLEQRHDDISGHPGVLSGKVGKLVGQLFHPGFVQPLLSAIEQRPEHAIHARARALSRVSYDVGYSFSYSRSNLV